MLDKTRPPKQDARHRQPPLAGRASPRGVGRPSRGRGRGGCPQEVEEAHHARRVRGLRDRRQGAAESAQPEPDAVVRPRLRRVLHALVSTRDQPRHVAQLQHAGVAEPLGRRRGLQGHVPPPRVPGLPLGRPARRPRQLGLQHDLLRAQLPGPGQLRRLELRPPVPRLVARRAVPDARSRGLAPGHQRPIPGV